jgi:hypothetical protein
MPFLVPTQPVQQAEHVVLGPKGAVESLGASEQLGSPSGLVAAPRVQRARSCPAIPQDQRRKGTGKSGLVLRGPALNEKLYSFRYDQRGVLASSVKLPKPWLAVYLDFAGAIALFMRLLMVPEAFFACLCSISSVLLYHYFAPEQAVNLNWVAASVCIVFPITNSISSAFKRREGAIQALGEFRSLIANIYFAHAWWDWPGPRGWHGRDEDGVREEDGGRGVKAKGLYVLPRDHAQQVRVLMQAILDSTQELLLVPRRGRMRHIHTKWGQVCVCECVRVVWYVVCVSGGGLHDGPRAGHGARWGGSASPSPLEAFLS